MLDKSKVKTRLDIDNTDRDSLIDTLITDAYNYIQSYLDVKIESDDTITEVRYRKANQRYLYTSLPIKTLSSIKDEDGDEHLSDISYTDTHIDFYSDDNIDISIPYDLDEEYTLKYSVRDWITAELERISFTFVSFRLKEILRDSFFYESKTAVEVTNKFITEQNLFAWIERELARITNIKGIF